MPCTLNVSRRVARLFAVVALCSVAACGPDETQDTCSTDADCPSALTCAAGRCVGSDAGVQDAGADVVDPSTYCDDAPLAENVGVACSGMDEAFCGAGGTCVSPPQGSEAVCAQLCFEALCGDTCEAPTTCVALATNGGAPAGIDLDGDGENDTDIGACVERPVGDVQVFGACGGTDFCDQGMDCLLTEPGSTRGRCYPRCAEDGSCADVAGQANVCVLVIDPADDAPATHCVPECEDRATSTDCPESFVCVANGAVAVCLPPGLGG